jgi:hypothetical protein
MQIPYGVLKLDLSVIPPIRSKRRRTNNKDENNKDENNKESGYIALVSSIFIQSSIPFTLFASPIHSGDSGDSGEPPLLKSDFAPGRYFIYVPPRAQSQFLIPASLKAGDLKAGELKAGNLKVYDQCILSAPAPLLDGIYPYIQLGDTGLFFYHGTLVNTPLVWKDQIQYPLHDFSFHRGGAPVWSTRFFHTRGLEMSQQPELQSLCITVNCYTGYNIDREEPDLMIAQNALNEQNALIHLEYNPAKRDAIHRWCLAHYSFSFLDCTYDVVRSWMSFEQAVKYIQTVVNIRARLPAHAKFHTWGNAWVTEEEYERMVRNRV